MRAHNKNLTLLPEAERQALYERPDFDEFQRAEYFAFTPAELALAQQRAGLPEQILCLLQIGYFKAKRAFFTLTELPDEDAAFLRERYFPEQSLQPRPIRSAEYYVQRRQILQLFDYRPWSQQDAAQLARKAAYLARRDVTPAFILTELVAGLAEQRIVRPGYTVFQAIISAALSAERQRLGELVETALTDEVKTALQGLLEREDTLSELAAIKQDAKHFRPHMMARERSKRASLATIYGLARVLLPQLDISQQNVTYYARAMSQRQLKVGTAGAA